MTTLIVVNNPTDWAFNIPNAQTIDAKSYLTDPQYNESRGVKVFNLCRSYRYQSVGYYVSLLAEARGHKPQPSVATIQDLKNQSIVRLVSEDLDHLIQTSLAAIKTDRFTLSVYFGRNLAKRYERLSRQLTSLFQAPLLRAKFAREKKGWQLKSLGPIAANEVPEAHRDFVAEAAAKYLTSPGRSTKRAAVTRYDLALLYEPDEEEPPSDERALKKFVKAAAQLGMGIDFIDRNDYGRLAEYDGLFIRTTTAVNHYTYRFARRAVEEGMVVIDDPQSIVRCTNKVYLAELLNRYKLPTPKTLVIDRENAAQIPEELGFPCVLKKPDSSFSRGVVKVESEEDLDRRLEEYLAESDLLIAQQYLPTTFDWRIGVLDRQPLYAAKYFMARNHWQIIRQDREDNGRYGRAEPIGIQQAPKQVVRIALQAANGIGDGLYGVDVKQVGEKEFYVIEVNDNPNIDAGCEDSILGDDLYRRIMEVFLRRIEQRKSGVMR